MKNHRLTPFEWEIMNILWDLDSATVRDVADALPAEMQRAYTTVQTYVERLTDKKVLKKEKLGNRNVYRALIPRQTMMRSETRSIVDRLFGGSYSSMAAYLVRNGDLDEGDIEKLKTIISGEDS